MAKPEIRIITDFPDPLPISAGELALLEAYFGAEIAALADDSPTPAPDADPKRSAR